MHGNVSVLSVACQVKTRQCLYMATPKLSRCPAPLETLPLCRCPQPHLFQAFLDNNIALLSFTVDPFGGISYFAHCFLYVTSSTLPHKPPESPPPTWRNTLSLPHMIALYDQLHSLPTGLLPKATKAYTPPPTTLTMTPLSPLSWAHQFIALNA
jgi:hypothetical protein